MNKLLNHAPILESLAACLNYIELKKLASIESRFEVYFKIRKQKLKLLKIELHIKSACALTDLDNFRFIHNNYNELNRIPPEIGLLTNLQEIDLDDNEITKIPPNIAQLTNLRGLYLHMNQITAIPPEIELLTNLQKLDLGWNEITEIPPEIGQLINLKEQATK